MGRPVMEVYIQQPSKLQLHDIMYVETEEDQIVFFRNYYFCDEFLKESADAFGMPVQSEETKWIKE